jgi:hypothetical protein
VPGGQTNKRFAIINHQCVTGNKQRLRGARNSSEGFLEIFWTPYLRGHQLHVQTDAASKIF